MSSRLVLRRRKNFDFYENFKEDINTCAKMRFSNVTAGSAFDYYWELNN